MAGKFVVVDEPNDQSNALMPLNQLSTEKGQSICLEFLSEKATHSKAH